MPTPPISRTVTYSVEYERSAAAIEPDARRLDEMIRGAEWALARTEKRGEVVVVLNPGAGGLRLEVRATVTDTGAVVTRIGRAE